MTSASQPPTAALLGEAAEALRAGDHSRALGLLLTSWREGRHPEISARIAQVTAQAVPLAPAHLPAQDPVEVGRRVSTPVVRWMQNLLAVADSVAQAPPDPRIGEWAARQLVEGGLNRVAEETFLALLERHGHAGLEPLLALAQVKRPRKARLSALRAALLTSPPPSSDPALRLALSALDQALAAASGADPRLLLLRAYEHPEDPDVMKVLADHLCERGDPRGEYINLQGLHEAGGGDEQTRKAEASLWRKHWRRWYPELAALLAPTSSRCRHGLLWRAGLHTPEGAPLAQVVSRPCFRSVREVVAHGDGSFALVPCLPAHVEAVWDVAGFALRGLEVRPWRRLGLRHFFDDELAQALPQLPALEVLGVQVYSGQVGTVRRALSRPLATLCLGGDLAPEEVLHLFADAPVAEVRLGRTSLEAWDAPVVRAVREGSKLLRA